MKKLAYYVSALVLSAAVLFTSCKKDSEPTPDPDPEAKVFTSTMTATNGGSSDAAIVFGRVTTADGLVKLRLDVTHSGSNNLSKIFIMKSEDNGAFSPMSYSGSIVNAAGKTFTGGSSDYTFDVPGSTKSFILDIPVSVRTTSAAVTDVYQIWLTDGAGGFTKPTKNRVLGIATITLKYTAVATTETFATATLNVGSQLSDNYGSFVVTSGQVSSLITSDYNDAPGSADLRFVTLNGSGKKDNSTSNIYFYSPANVGDANPAGDASADFTVFSGDPNPLMNSRTTKLEVYAGSNFDDITAADLSALTVASGTNVALTVGGVYKFETQDGKKGLVKVNSTEAAIPLRTTVPASYGRNANITIKVLN